MATTLLLFEPDPDIRQLMSELLEESGYHVRDARSLDEASGIVDTEAVSLVLADAGEADRMRAMELFELYCGRIGRKVPMIVFTAHNVTREEVQAMGCADLLPKPFDISTLLQLIKDNLPAPG